MDVDDDGPSPNDSDMEVDTSSNPHMARVPQLEIGSKTLLFVYDGQKVKIELCSMVHVTARSLRYRSDLNIVLCSV